MKTNFIKYLFPLILLSMAITSCGNSDQTVTVAKEPTDVLIKKFAKSDFSIVLNDMNVTETSGLKKYEHKYNVLKLENDSLKVDSLGWKTVNRSFFEKHENDLGMEIVSRHDGKLSRVARPVGFGWAIGNSKYGSWEEQKTDSTAVVSNETSNNSGRRWRSNGSSFIFWYWMMRRPAYRSNYYGYQKASSSEKPFYGTSSNGKTQYGTRSSYQKAKRPSFFSRKEASKTWSSHNKEKTMRSSSRYKKSSSTRSRSGGFGK